MQLIVIIKRILPTKSVGSNGFEMRELHGTTEDQYPQTLNIQFTQGRCALLDNFKAGQKVKIDINIKGREWTNKQEKTTVFNTIDGWKIEEVV